MRSTDFTQLTTVSIKTLERLTAFIYFNENIYYSLWSVYFSAIVDYIGLYWVYIMWRKIN